MFTNHDENDKNELEELLKSSPSNKWPKSKNKTIYEEASKNYRFKFLQLNKLTESDII